MFPLPFRSLDLDSPPMISRAFGAGGVCDSSRRYSAYALLVLALLTPSFASAQEDAPVFSGPQAGEKLQPFAVRGVYDDQAGKDINLLSEPGDETTLLIFVHDVTRPSIGLTRALVDYASKQETADIVSAVVFLTDDVTDTENWMKRARYALPKKTTLGIGLGGQEGPGAYGLNRNVTLTILVAKQGKVTANFALVQPSLQADAVEIATAVAKTAGLEKMPELKDLNVRGMRPKRDDDQDDELRELLIEMIRKDATPAEVDAAAAKVEAYVKSDKKTGDLIVQICKRIVEANTVQNYGSPTAHKYIRKWSNGFGPVAQHTVAPR